MARILVIDDEDAIRRMLRIAFEHNGHQVFELPSGRDAVRLHSETPVDLVITDINMPDTDGLEVVRALRLQDPRPKVIVISGAEGALHDRTFHMAELLGAFVTLRKPFDLGAMLSVVEAALAA